LVLFIFIRSNKKSAAGPRGGLAALRFRSTALTD